MVGKPHAIEKLLILCEGNSPVTRWFPLTKGQYCHGFLSLMCSILYLSAALLHLYNCVIPDLVFAWNNLSQTLPYCGKQYKLIMHHISTAVCNTLRTIVHDDVIKWKHFPRNCPFVRGIHRSPVNSPHKGQWHGALIFSLICVWINDWVNNREAGDLRCYRTHYDVIVMRCQVHVQPRCFICTL